jgi:protein pelota
MKTIKRDLKAGKIVLRVEVPDDLWYLSDIISEGDTVISKTKRRMEQERDVKRAERGEKITITLGVKVDSVEFDRNVDRLRIGGTVVSGPESVPAGSYHTLNVQPGMVVTVVKERWQAHELIRVKDAENVIKAKILLVAMEEGYAELGILRNYGIKPAGTIRESISGKDEIATQAAETQKFFAGVASAIENELEGLERVVIAGPGFVKDSFYKYLQEKKPGIAKLTVVESVSTGGQKGLEELVKRGVIERVVKEAKIHSEVKYLNRLFEEISRGELAAYGFDEVKKAVDSGAVEVLLVSNSLLKQYKIEKKGGLENLIKAVEQMKGKVMLVSEEHELGKQFEGMGGIGAILRYRI